jgi:hypothetical protein
MLAPAETPFSAADMVKDPALRIRRDFALLPGLALTIPQARRLWALPESVCRQLLDALVAEGFLRVRPDARYVLRDISRATA